MNVARILGLAKFYAGTDWQEWNTSDLAEIYHLISSLAQKHAIKYEIEMIADESVELDEEAPSKSKIEVLHDLIMETINEGNIYAVRETLEQMLVVCAESIKDERE